jgi:arginase
LRLKQIQTTVADLGYDVVGSNDAVEIDYDQPAQYGEKLARALQVYRAVAHRVEGTLKAGNLAMMLGGDHSLSIGSVSGALRVFGKDLAVLWIDAHMDLNTPSTSPSGNFHGMPVAALLGLPAGESPRYQEAIPAWNRILSDIVPGERLGKDRIGWLGLRDVDGGELDHYDALGLQSAWAMQDIDHLGISEILREVDEWMRQSGATKLWVSFDVDSLDPVLAPGTGTAVRGGLTYREGHLLAELLYEMTLAPGSAYQLVGFDLVEVNPIEDIGSSTSTIAVEWVASLLGKRTMRRERR